MRRDSLLKIGRLCPQFTVFTELATQECFSNLIGNLSGAVVKELDHCFMRPNWAKINTGQQAW